MIEMGLRPVRTVRDQTDLTSDRRVGACHGEIHRLLDRGGPVLLAQSLNAGNSLAAGRYLSIQVAAHQIRIAHIVFNKAPQVVVRLPGGNQLLVTEGQPFLIDVG